jgi:hypothetical protein
MLLRVGVKGLGHVNHFQEIPMSEVTQVKAAVEAATSSAVAADKTIVQAAATGFVAKVKALASTYKLHAAVGAAGYVGGKFGALGAAAGLIFKHL